MKKYAYDIDAKAISRKLLSDLKEGKLSRIGIDEVNEECYGYKNFDWLVEKVLRLVIVHVLSIGLFEKGD